MKDQKFVVSGACFGLLALWLTACSSLGLDSDATYSDKDHDNIYKNGSVLSDKGGADLLDLGGDDNAKSPGGAGIGVNGFLWRATLDTVSFMPISSADPFGGVIITDWYSAPDNLNERTRLNIFIRDRDLRADGVKVSVFRQVKGPGGNWVDAPVAPATGSSLENAILTKARQIRLTQKDFK
jgi:hypothetical protein